MRFLSVPIPVELFFGAYVAAQIDRIKVKRQGHN